MPENTPLSDEERSELERLRAEKAASEKDAAEQRRFAEAREKGRQLMEPDDDDLRMPKGQKIVIAAVVVVAVVWLLALALG